MVEVVQRERLAVGRFAGVVGLLVAQPAQAQDNHAQSSAERLVTIRDRGHEQTIMTRARTVRQALQLARVTVDETRDVVEPNIDLELTGTTFTVTIFRARPVTIIDGSRRNRRRSELPRRRELRCMLRIKLNL